MKPEIKNIADLNAQVFPLNDLIMNGDISFTEALAGLKNLYDILSSAIENCNDPAVDVFFQGETRRYSIEEAKALRDIMGAQIEIFQGQLDYRKYRAEGYPKIDYFEWE